MDTPPEVDDAEDEEEEGAAADEGPAVDEANTPDALVAGLLQDWPVDEPLPELNDDTVDVPGSCETPDTPGADEDCAAREVAGPEPVEPGPVLVLPPLPPLAAAVEEEESAPLEDAVPPVVVTLHADKNRRTGTTSRADCSILLIAGSF